MSEIVFDPMCRNVLNCRHYVEWELELEMHDHGRNYESTMTCVSCQIVGQSYNIEKYPAECLHKAKLKKYAIQKEKEMIAYAKRCEQEQIWKRLNDT